MVDDPTRNPISSVPKGPRRFTPTGSTTGTYDVQNAKPGEKTPFTNERPLYDQDRIGPADHAIFRRDEPKDEPKDESK
jgi:hypothetical protein